MDIQKIENEALHLPRKERADLIQRLVLSLDTPGGRTPSRLASRGAAQSRGAGRWLGSGGAG